MDEQEIIIATEAITVLLQDYRPAGNQEESTAFLSTIDIIEAIALHTGINPSFNFVIGFMKQHHFTYTRMGETALTWMLAEKT